MNEVDFFDQIFFLSLPKLSPLDASIRRRMQTASDPIRARHSALPKARRFKARQKRAS